MLPVRTLNLALLAVLPLISVACRSQNSIAGEGMLVQITRDTLVESSIGKRVLVQGVAKFYKAGAVVLVGKRPIFLQDVDRWPPSLKDQPVWVVGTLVKVKYIPDPEVEETGRVVAAGTKGLQLVITEPSWARPPP